MTMVQQETFWHEQRQVASWSSKRIRSFFFFLSTNGIAFELLQTDRFAWGFSFLSLCDCVFLQARPFFFFCCFSTFSVCWRNSTRTYFLFFFIVTSSLLSLSFFFFSMPIAVTHAWHAGSVCIAVTHFLRLLHFFLLLYLCSVFITLLPLWLFHYFLFKKKKKNKWEPREKPTCSPSSALFFFFFS